MKYSFRRFISLIPTSLVALLTGTVGCPLGGSPQISQGLKSGQAVKPSHMQLVTTVLWFLITLSASLTVAATIEPAKKKPPQPLGPVTCSQLATDPALRLAGNPVIKNVTSEIIPLPPSNNESYCQVDLLYGKSPEQNINIRVGLPLNSSDGGTGGIQGAWNGRTQGVGGGGCAGNLIVTAPVNAGYVGSGTDTGHTGGDCEPGVNLDGTYNLQFIEDFIRNAIKQQVLLSKSIARTYYEMAPAYNYWNGCSTGGRAGDALAQA